MTVEELLSRFGSPLYVYRLDEVDEALHDLRAALPTPSKLYYSVKANPHPDVIRRLAAAGCRAEISSSGELAAAHAGGVVGTECLYTGPGKTTVELAAAIAAGVTLFSCESLTDLRRVGAAATAAGVEVDCLLRVDNARDGVGGLRMTGKPSQFGIDATGVLTQRCELGAVPGTRIAGLHFFPVSNVRDEAALIAQFRASIEMAARLDLPLSRVDLGGGFPAPFAEPGPRHRFRALRESLESVLDQRLPGWRDGNPEIMFESGRYLTGTCGSLACTTMELKPSAAGAFAIVDSGINHLGGMAGLGRLARPAATPAGGAGGAVGTITGPLCTPADVLGRNVPLGDLAAGSTVVFPNVGAYGLTASLIGFLSRPAPAEVVCDGEGVVSASRLTLVRTVLKAEQQ